MLPSLSSLYQFPELGLRPDVIQAVIGLLAVAAIAHWKSDLPGRLFKTSIGGDEKPVNISEKQSTSSDEEGSSTPRSSDSSGMNLILISANS